MTREEVLAQCLGYLMAQESSQLATQQEQLILRSLYFLVEQQSRHNLQNFVQRTLPRILEQLNHTTKRIKVDYQGRIRGKIDWSATQKARYSQGYDPSIYTCRQVNTFYDTLENQLLKYLLEKVSKCLHLIPRSLRQGFCLMPGNLESLTESISPRIQTLEMALRAALGNIYLSQVSLINQVTPLHLQQCQNSRSEEYTEIAFLYQRYSQIFTAEDWHPFAQKDSYFLLLPQGINPEAKVWIHLAAHFLKTYTNEDKNHDSR